MIFWQCRARKWRRQVSWAIGLALLCLVAQTGVAEDEEEDRSEEFARSLLKRWLWESGGAKKIQDVPAIRMEGKVSTPAFSIPMVQLASRAGHFLQELSYQNGMHFREVVTPDRAWFEHSFLGVGVMRQTEAAERVRWLGPWLALDWEHWYRSVRKLKDQQFEGRFSNVAELELVGGGSERWYLDFADGMLHTVVRPADLDRPLSAMRIDAWRELNGFALPRKITRFDSGFELAIERDEFTALDEVPQELFRLDESKWEDATMVEALLARYHETIGGDTMLRTLRSRVIRQTLNVLSSGVVVRMISYRKIPNLSLDVKHVEGIGTTWSGFNGKQAWEFSEITGFRLLEGAELQQTMIEADMFSAARMRDQFRLVSELRRAESTDGVHHIARLSSFSAPGGEFHFNAETGFIDKVISGVVAPGGGVLQVEVALQDFREFDGVWIPTRVHTTNPAIETVSEVLSVEHNVDLPDELFAPRPEGVDYFEEYSRWEDEETVP